MEFNLSNLTSEQIELLVKDLLTQTNIVRNIEHNKPPFDRTKRAKYQPDLVSYEGNVVNEIVEIKAVKKVSKKLITELIDRVKEFYLIYFPHRFILVVTNPVRQSFIDEIHAAFEREVAIEVEVLGLTWINETLRAYPEIANIHSLIEVDKPKDEHRKIIVDSGGSKTNHPKHALSIAPRDETLIGKGYENQGLIGYLYRVKSDISIPLNQYFLDGVHEYLYFIEESREDLRRVRKSEKKLLGYMATEPAATTLNLFRYFREKPFWDHLFCTQPHESSITNIGYKREDNGFKTAYLADKLTPETVPLYVYSTMPDLILFKKFKEIDKTTLAGSLDMKTNLKTSREIGRDSESIDELINSKLESNSKFWWHNDKEITWGLHTFKQGGSFGLLVPDANKLDWKVGELVLLYDVNGTESVHGVFELTELKPDSAQGKYLYEFQNSPAVYELNRGRLFNDSGISKNLRAPVIELELDLFQEIINSTELGNQDTKWSETHPEVDALYESSGDKQKKTAAYKNEQRSTSIDGDIDFEIPDLLDIENDVRSFALLLASNNIKPPVAIALFGKWGSGKSFFMKLLQKRINELSINQGFLLDPDDIKTNRRKNTDEELFCKGIAQIEFNAWSYLDANLWAGLVTSIFEKLNEYISETTKSGVAKMKVQEELKKRLKTLQTKKLTEEERREELQNLKIGYQIEGKKLKESILSNFSDKILSFIDEDDDLKTAHSRISKDGYLAELSTQLNLGKLEEEAQTFKSFVRNLKKVKPLLKYVIPAGVGIMVAISIQRFSIELNITWSAIIPFLGSLGIDLGILKNRYNRVKSYVKEFNHLIDSNSVLQTEVVNHRLLAENAREQIEQANVQIEELNKDIDNFKSYMEEEIHQEAIRDFIQTRADHIDYKDKLGIVSIIRRDFETLSELFYHGSDANVGASTIDASEKQVIREQFQKGKRLERIILYIDDLDRCSDKKVLEVIQAVHLLMAFPLFNVVVGVDKKCVTNALLLQTKLKYRKIATIEEIEKIGIDMISPSDYLEKIFQIPFELKEPEEKDINALADSLLNDQIQKQTPDTEIEKPEAADEIEEQSSEDIRFQISHSDDLPDEPPMMSLLTYKGKQEDEPTAENQNVSEEQESKKLVTATINNLEFSQLEVDQLKEILFLVGNTPRTVKRFINVYRIIRAHKRPEMNRKLETEDHIIIMFLLAIGLGEFKIWADEINALIKKNPKATLKTTIGKIKGAKGSEKMTKHLKSLLSQISELNNISAVLNLKGDLLLKHIPFVSRFSFGKDEQSKVEPENTTA